MEINKSFGGRKKNSLRNTLAAGGLIGICGLLLANCSSDPVNYEGAGNGFQARGVVAGVEDDGTVHVDEKQIIIEVANGRATSWFANGDGQDVFSDEFNFEPKYRHEGDGWFGSCEVDVPVGHVFDTSGQEIKPQDLHAGQVIEISGSIRESNAYKHSGKTTYCGEEDYPVFDVIQVQEGALQR